MSRVDAKYQEKFETITHFNFVGQAKWYLNAFWKAHGESKAEEIWTFTQRMGQMEKKKGKEGDSIDEFEAHKFLESFGETLTVIELREKLRTIDVNNDKRMALIEYLLFKYPEGSMQTLCESIQREDDPELLEAQRLVQEAADAFTKATEEAENARAAKAEADQKEQDAAVAAAAAKSSADAAKKDFDAADEKRVIAETKAAESDAAKKAAEAVEDELKAVLAELKKQEEDYAEKIKQLESVAGTPGVKGGQAAAELLKLKNENPMPLRKAQAEQGVVIKKAEKVRKVAEEANNVAQSAAAEAKAAADAAANSAAIAKQAQDDAEATAAAASAAAAEAARTQALAEESAAAAQKSLEAAQDNVQKIKAKTSSQGTIWWMEREMIEMAKFQAPSGKKK